MDRSTYKKQQAKNEFNVHFKPWILLFMRRDIMEHVNERTFKVVLCMPIFVIKIWH